MDSMRIKKRLITADTNSDGVMGGTTTTDTIKPTKP